METDKNNTNIPVTENMKNIDGKHKSLTPAILGMPHSHGVKFSANMTSEHKKELLAKLEEWRKARKQKLAATILAKQKQFHKTKAIPLIPTKSKPTPAGGNGTSRIQEETRQSVFERLYQNNGKVRKQGIILRNTKPQQVIDTHIRKSICVPLNKLQKSGKAILVEKDETEFLQKGSKSGSDEVKKESHSFMEESIQSCGIKSVFSSAQTENCSVGITEKKSDMGMEFTKPLHPVCDQIKITDDSSLKSQAALKSLSIKAAESQRGKILMRRSISMMFRQKCKKENFMRRSISAKNLHEINLDAQRADNKSFQTQQNNWISKNEVVARPLTFATPKNTKSFTSTYLRNTLEDWLKVNGHSLEGYRHLRCFGIGESENGKPFAQASVVPSDESSENSYYATAPNTPEVDSDKENVTPLTVIQRASVKDVENWLEELHRLIVEVKYPLKRCEEWLAAIKKKCSSCSQLPIYWECLASLHESKGDLKSAIEDYERAIIKGGEVNTVGESLAQLFDKMVIEQEKHSKPKLEKGIDPKNIFKSTIIKFALQQKAIKKLSSEMEPSIHQQLYVATPVRRSARLQSPFVSSEEIASLRTLTPEVRKNVTFKPNQSLLGGD